MVAATFDVDSCLRDCLELYIDRYIKKHNATLIYWCHSIGHWKYVVGSDTTPFKQEMKNLIEQIKNGKIVNVNQGVVVDVMGTQLYPIEIEFKGVQCHAYRLVAKRGNTHDLNMTPYFFPSEEKRDEIFDYLLNKGNG